MSKLTDLLKEDEGYRKLVYDDHTGAPPRVGQPLRGILTIGVGRNLQHKGLTDDEIEYLLNNDITECSDNAHALFPNYGALDEVRQAVVISMFFNLGKQGFAAFVRTVDAIRQQQWERAANEMLDSRWAEQVGKRAVRLSNMMRHGTWSV